MPSWRLFAHLTTLLQAGDQREQVPQGPCFVNHHSPCAELPDDPLIPMLVSSGEAAGHGQVSRGHLGPSSERPSQPGRCRSHLTHLQSLWCSSNGRMDPNVSWQHGQSIWTKTRSTASGSPSLPRPHQSHLHCSICLVPTCSRTPTPGAFSHPLLQLLSLTLLSLSLTFHHGFPCSASERRPSGRLDSKLPQKLMPFSFGYDSV